jgi:hypothetical protein
MLQNNEIRCTARKICQREGGSRSPAGFTRLGIKKKEKAPNELFRFSRRLKFIAAAKRFRLRSLEVLFGVTRRALLGRWFALWQ